MKGGAGLLGKEYIITSPLLSADNNDKNYNP